MIKVLQSIFNILNWITIIHNYKVVSDWVAVIQCLTPFYQSTFPSMPASLLSSFALFLTTVKIIICSLNFNIGIHLSILVTKGQAHYTGWKDWLNVHSDGAEQPSSLRPKEATFIYGNRMLIDYRRQTDWKKNMYQTSIYHSRYFPPRIPEVFSFKLLKLDQLLEPHYQKVTRFSSPFKHHLKNVGILWSNYLFQLR